MKIWQAFASGLIGAASLTLMHELARKTVPAAPRVDLLGMQAVSKSLEFMDKPIPRRSELRRITMAGDLISNGLFYSMVGLGGDGRSVWLRGGALGLLAGLGAVYLPSPLGLQSKLTNRTTLTQILTILLYTEGGLVAAAAASLFHRNSSLEERSIGAAG